ncbi:MAG: hypothetical protein ACREBD_33410, partial [Blastocatellia bacterium]
ATHYAVRFALSILVKTACEVALADGLRVRQALKSLQMAAQLLKLRGQFFAGEDSIAAFAGSFPSTGNGGMDQRGS